MRILSRFFSFGKDKRQRNEADDLRQKNNTDYVNSNNIISATNYLIWVNLNSFKVNIYKGSKNNWNLVHSYVCTIGKPATPTPKGNYTVGVKGLYFGVNKGYKCWYYTQFKGNYLFHSIIYNLDGSVRDGRLGMKLSDGCIRLAKENAKWIYDNIPRGTKVVIN
ncbi:murein L,D-transpeptidase [Clostridium chromiireducens]|uniref:L,D-transpeptidase family protein n=1 Tax=Clostridium chromiireducens TaxID=225345 RepID=A0A399IKA7_9CLOT|nr:L,D-transpeptidase [Clostridium chromiireducens]MVX63534.1 L,D-transpeptidase family protein [Clostridium chromiireducens]RII33390.1 murein L,D-transpeptidase [Clostridium chromiireducens]